jgi:REP element-mobilizing transposase RayT
MRNPMFYHIYWRTKYREKMDERVINYLERLAPVLCKNLGADPIATAIHEADHIHLLIALPQHIDIESFARRFKAITAKKVNENTGRTGKAFWQKRFLGKTISGENRKQRVTAIKKVKDYIKRNYSEEILNDPRKMEYLRKSIAPDNQFLK